MEVGRIQTNMPLHFHFTFWFHWFLVSFPEQKKKKRKRGREYLMQRPLLCVWPSVTYHQVTRLSHFREMRHKSSLQDVGYRFSWNVSTCLPNCTASYITRYLTQYPVTRMEMEREIT
jgi:hypothetical protein